MMASLYQSGSSWVWRSLGELISYLHSSWVLNVCPLTTGLLDKYMHNIFKTRANLTPKTTERSLWTPIVQLLTAEFKRLRAVCGMHRLSRPTRRAWHGTCLLIWGIERGGVVCRTTPDGDASSSLGYNQP